MGINVSNCVAQLAGRVQDPPTRLADVVTPCPSVTHLRNMLGDALADTFDHFLHEGSGTLMHALASAWGEPRPVVVITDTERYCGHFTGIDMTGSPVLRKADGTLFTVCGASILRLKELI